MVGYDEGEDKIYMVIFVNLRLDPWEQTSVKF